MAAGEGKIKESIGEAASVEGPQDTTGTVTRQIAAASTGKVGTDLGGAQTNASTAATINTVEGKMAAGKAAALERAKGIKQKRDATVQQGEAQSEAIDSQRSSSMVQAEQQSSDLLTNLQENSKDMSLKQKLATGEQLDFMKQMKHKDSEATFKRQREGLRNLKANDRRKAMALAGAAQALQDSIQELEFARTEAKKQRDFAEANLMHDEITKSKADLAQINDNVNALMVSAGASGAKAGFAAYKESGKKGTSDA